MHTSCLERVARIELALSGRKHDILPLNYTRTLKLILLYRILENLSIEKRGKIIKILGKILVKIEYT